METETLLDFLSTYSVIVGSTAYPPVIFIWVALLEFFIISLRTINWKIQDKNRTLKQMGSFAIRQIPCYIFAVVTSFTLTCIFGNNHNKILNGFICPGIGYLASIIFDEKVLNISMKKYTASTSGDQKNDHATKNTVSPNIVVNIDNKSDGNNTNYEFEESDKNVYFNKPSNDDYITDNDLSQPTFHEKVQKKINGLIYARYIGATEVMKIIEVNTKQTEMLEAICCTLKDEKKLELEKLIYNCLTKGYATPNENKAITTKYRNYKALGGNGEIQELYEKHYLLLPIREDMNSYSNDKYFKRD